MVEAGSYVQHMLAGQTLVDWHPSGEGVVVRTRGLTGGTLYRVRTAGGNLEKVMPLSRNTGSIILNPDPRKNYLVHSEDTRGNEYYQLFLYDLAAKKARRLTDGSSRHTGGTFDRKGERMAFLGRSPNSAETRFYVMNPLKPSSLRMICRVPGGWSLGRWSPDGERLLVSKGFPRNHFSLYILDVRTGEFRRLGAGNEGEVTHGAAVWSHDGRYVYYASDWQSEFLTLRRVDLATLEEEELTNAIRWDVVEVEISADDTSLVLVLNEEGAKKLYLLDPKTNEFRKLPGAASESDYNVFFHPAARKLAWTHVAGDATESVGGYDIEAAAPVDWTRAPRGKDGDQQQPRLVHYPTFDHVDGKPRMIPAWFWQARSIDGRPTPVLVNIHGGPEGQSGPVHPALGLLSRRGISELQPNIRGSTGYGKTYRGLDDGRKRVDAIKDIGALLDWIKTQPNLDSTRVAVYGGSCGGFMALASAVQFSHRLACAIDLFGISNFENMIRETSEGMREWARSEFGDERDPEMTSFLASISPLNRPTKSGSRCSSSRELTTPEYLSGNRAEWSP